MHQSCSYKINGLSDSRFQQHTKRPQFCYFKQIHWELNNESKPSPASPAMRNSLNSSFKNIRNPRHWFVSNKKWCKWMVTCGAVPECWSDNLDTISNNSFPKIGTEITTRFWPHFFIQLNTIGDRSENGINTCEQSSSHGRPFQKSQNAHTFAQKSTWHHFHATKRVRMRFHIISKCID